MLFDLGGVIINLNTQLTAKAFAEIAERPEEDVVAAWRKEEAFREYERGKISDNEFRDFLRKWLKKPLLPDEEIDEAWNSMILDLPQDRLNLLLELKNDYQVMLLSNTNDIHLHRVNEHVFKASGEATLDPFFHKVYYSHRMGMRKPEPQIFQEILKLHNVQPEDVLFLDDSVENLKGAEVVGIKTLEVKDPQVIFNVRDYV